MMEHMDNWVLYKKLENKFITEWPEISTTHPEIEVPGSPKWVVRPSECDLGYPNKGCNVDGEYDYHKSKNFKTELEHKLRRPEWFVDMVYRKRIRSRLL